MKILESNLWDSTDNIILTTASSTLTRRDTLVMGAGAALEMKKRFPGCDYYFGNRILQYGDVYGVITKGVAKDKFIGVFQTKYDWRDRSDLDLIRYSVFILDTLINYVCAGMSISMNFPGIGLGQLREKDVLPIIEKLPDNVTVYKMGAK